MATAAGSETAAIAPATAAPTGKPMKLIPIETAKARPIQAGSVRRWRTVKRAMSSGPCRRPMARAWAPRNASPAARPTWTSAAPTAGRMSATAAALRNIGTTIIPHSRPRVSTRPKASAEAIPVIPERAKTSPTTASPAPRTRTTARGITIVVMPAARLTTESEKPSPRSVWLRHQ